MSSTQSDNPPPTSPSKLTSMDELRAYLRTMNKTKVLQWALGWKFEGAPLHADPLICSMDLEWYCRDASALTEIGLSFLDYKKLRRKPRGTDGRGILKLMECQHMRITQRAHIVNLFPKGSDPTKFLFGESIFFTEEEARDCLKHLFSFRDSSTGALRPIIFLGHAVSNDLSKLQQTLGLDPKQFDSIVAIVDTQVVARENAIYSAGPTIGLTPLCHHFNIEPQYRHNGGNDAAYTLICGVLMAVTSYNTSHGVKNTAYDEEPIENVVNRMWNRAWPDCRTVYCTRCDSLDHMKGNCRARVVCEKCKNANKAENIWRSHKTSKCLAR